MSVVILDKSGVAEGDTSRTTAHLTVELDVRYHELLGRLGKEATERVVSSQWASIRQIESFVQELGVNCGFRHLPGYFFAEDQNGVEELEREFEALRTLGVPASLTRSAALPFPVKGAVRIESQAEFRPLEYCRALTAAFLENGGKIYTHAQVTEIDDGDPCTVFTEGGGEIAAGFVLVCTYSPVSNRVFLHTKVASYRTYAVAGEIPDSSEWDGLFWDAADPYHYWRTAMVDGKRQLIVGGEDRKTGETENTEERFAELESYVKKRAPEVKFKWRWSGQIVNSLDGLPFIGRNALDKNVFVATGYSGNGITQGTLAGLLLRDAVLDRHNPWSDLYSATRLLGLSQLPEYVQENKDYAVCLITDRLKPAPSPDSLRPGEGGIVFANGNRAAAYREDSGKWKAFDPVCPHLGCFVRFNSAEKTWDCPCHGSRFSLDGEVLNGPARSALTPVSTDSWPQGEEEVPEPRRHAPGRKRAAS
jgi:glycine/D-amino acid oxidase-like deaminating enzyme/nitrite reductase/ring-hydroxylating ferredoxin subunit